MAGFDEKSLVEDYLVNQLQALGWKFVPADDLERESLEEPLLIRNLVREIKSINLRQGIGDDEVRQVLNELKLRGSTVEGIKQTLGFLKYGVPVKFEKDKVVKYVHLFDYANPKNNELVVSRQVSFRAGDARIRADIVLFVNGVPIVIIECKNPTDLSVSWVDAYRDIKDYEKSAPELSKYLQIGVAVEQTAKYFPIVPFAEDVETDEWKSGDKDSLDSMLDLLAPEVLLDIIGNYLFFRVERGKATKVIARYMQYRAAEKLVQRALAYARGKDTKNKGLVWHWQGSGKTLTMIFAAHKLFQHSEMANPSLIFIVDREELEQQLYQEFGALDVFKAEIVGSVEDLRRVLRHDEGRGKRGIFITLVHKFQPGDLVELQKELEELSEGRETVMDRKNVVAFVDEGHRTQYGLLAAQMREILKSASFFAFTGTPIAKIGRDTYEAFSYPKEEPHLDKYFITDSISDGFTLRIVYQPRLEKDVHLNKELLDSFLEVEFEEIPEEIRDQVKERVKKRINLIRAILKNPERVKQVAEDVALHFKDQVDDRFKAMLVAVDREACVAYKRALDRLLPKEYSEVVMTYTQHDPKQVEEYFVDLRQRFPGMEVEEINRNVTEGFKDDANPRILIVTEMLLTGFDAPKLQTMYLDKPLKEHRLLQAIARTNRPLGELKRFGVVIDYVGILKEFHRAFELYNKDDIKGALQDASELRREFVENVASVLALFEKIPRDKFDRTSMLSAIEVVTASDANRKKFLSGFKDVRHLFELLGPNAVKLKHLQEYKWLCAVFDYHTRMVSREEVERLPVEQFFQKTLKYIYRSTELENLNRELPSIEFGPGYLQELEKKVKNKEEKAANIVFALNRFVLTDRHRNPVVESLAEKVQRLVARWREKTKDFESLYREGVDLFQDYLRLTERQRKLGFTDAQFGVLLALETALEKKAKLDEDVRNLWKSVDELLFPGWLTQSAGRKNVERVVRKFLRRYVKERGLSLKELDELNGRIMEVLKQHARA